MQIKRARLEQIAHFANMALTELKRRKGTLPVAERELLQLCIDLEYGTPKATVITIEN